MDVPEEKAIFVLRDSVIKSLEEGTKGKRFSTFHAYLDMEGEDIDYETVQKLKGDFVEISDNLGGLELGLCDDAGTFNSVSGIMRRESLSHQAPLLLRATVRPEVRYDPRTILTEIIQYSIAMCDEAIRRECGFGKYSRPAQN